MLGGASEGLTSLGRERTARGCRRASNRAPEKAVEKEFGFCRKVISRAPSDLGRALKGGSVRDRRSAVFVCDVLRRAPTAAAVAKARGLAKGDEAWEVVGCEMHVRYVAEARREATTVESGAGGGGEEGGVDHRSRYQHSPS